MSDKEIDLILLNLMPMKASEIYKRFGASKRTGSTRKKIRARLNALVDDKRAYTTGRHIGLTYHKKDEDMLEAQRKELYGK